MRNIWHRLPGPVPAKVLQAALLILIALVILGFLFEWAGDLLDSGGAIG